MNSQREEELKPLPCPFCGNKPEWEYHEDPTYPQVECRNIECPIGLTNDQVSLYSWNTRTHPPKPTGGGMPECFETLYKHAKGMTFGTDWNNGTAAKHHRLRLISAVVDCATYLATQQPPEQGTPE